MNTTEKTTEKTTKTFRERYVEFDSRLTYIVGYRNLFNIAVMFIASWLFVIANTQVELATSSIVGILGLKWFLTRIYDNIDTSDVYEELEEIAQKSGEQNDNITSPSKSN